jgi:hypothetical protein
MPLGVGGLYRQLGLAVGVQRARVPHLIGAPRATTALAGPHRLMPIRVPTVVPLVPSNKAHESSLHGAALLQNQTVRRQASGVHDRGALTSTTGLLVIAMPAYQSVRPGPIKQILKRTLTTLRELPSAGGSWLTRKSLGKDCHRRLARVSKCCADCSRLDLGDSSPKLRIWTSFIALPVRAESARVQEAGEGNER